MSSDLNIKIFADGADLDQIIKLNEDSGIQGLTTNPTLMKKSGIEDYVKFALEVLGHVKTKPISFEVFADSIPEIIRQAKIIASWGPNVFVKVPITLTNGDFTGEALRILSNEGVQLNVTAIMTIEQVSDSLNCLSPNTPSNLSIFAGRIADTGVDPLPVMKDALKMIKEKNQKCQLIWASPREVLNVYQADEMGCDIITVTSDLIKKLSLHKKDLETYSRETVQMFYNDAASSGWSL
jgi:transaldolase